MKRLRGDLINLALDGHFDVIVHGCNCFHTMGAGLARQIKLAFPEAWSADCATPHGKRSKLGTCSHAKCHRPQGTVTVVNAYTQYRTGRGKQTSYSALRRCMRWVTEHCSGCSIGMPKIGAGLGGGDWHIIREIIHEELGDEDVTIVEYRHEKGR